MEKNSGAAPTGCYKCGRPGHWSRDCPSNPSTNTDNDRTTTKIPYPKTTSFDGSTSSYKATPITEKPKKAPRTNPKLTPDLLLSDDGFGHILRHFPRNFKFRGRGHEVDDLGHLLGLYADWHTHLIPYYPFEQFVHKAEQVCATKRIKVCIRQLRERVANGEDTTKLDKPHDEPEIEIPDTMDMEMEQPNLFEENTSDKVLEEMLYEMTEMGTQEPLQGFKSGESCGNKEILEKSVDQVSEEQRARMEANKKKALEKAAARAKSLNSTT